MLDVLVPCSRRCARKRAGPTSPRRVKATATASRRADGADARDQRPRRVSRTAQRRPYRSRRALELCDGRSRLRHLGGASVSGNVGIVIVSHSIDVAKGAADMVRQMVGEEVRVAFCGGNPDGGLGTDVTRILEAINSIWSPKGVAIMVDLGGAETNSEMAVEMLPAERRGSSRRLQRADRRRRGDGGRRGGGRQSARASARRRGRTVGRLTWNASRKSPKPISRPMRPIPPNDKAEGSVKLVHAVGMHARPAVKLTKLAKRFRSRSPCASSAPRLDRCQKRRQGDGDARAVRQHDRVRGDRRGRAGRHRRADRRSSPTTFPIPTADRGRRICKQ